MNGPSLLLLLTLASFSFALVISVPAPVATEDAITPDRPPNSSAIVNSQEEAEGIDGGKEQESFSADGFCGNIKLFTDQPVPLLTSYCQFVQNLTKVPGSSKSAAPLSPDFKVIVISNLWEKMKEAFDDIL